MADYKTKDNGIYELKMHEMIKLEPETQIRRVPGGWIYTEFHWDPLPGSTAFQVTSVFVPMI